MNIQGKHKLSIKKEEYIISVLENLADFRTHLQHEKKLTDSVLLKYSKYMYRILYSIGKATHNRNIQQHASQINKVKRYLYLMEY